MEFSEKILELRRSKGLTQEELAEVLFVSRTAISKWESGRGYPNIDSLKDISKFFSVSIDELLSGEKILSIAEKENKANIRKMCDLLLGIVDLLSVILIILPLYPKTVNGYIYAVNLFAYEELQSANRMIYWILFLMLMLVGAIKILITQCKLEKVQNTVTYCSMVLSVLVVLFLAMAREPYAVTVVFVLLIIKMLLLLKHTKNV